MIRHYRNTISDQYNTPVGFWDNSAGDIPPVDFGAANFVSASTLSPMETEHGGNTNATQGNLMYVFIDCLVPLCPTELRYSHLSGNRKHRCSIERHDEAIDLAGDASLFASTTNEYACSHCLVERGSACDCSARGFSIFNDMEIVDSRAFDA